MGSNLVCYWVSCGRGSTRFLLLLKMDEVSFCMTQISHPELILKSVGDTPIETTGSGGGGGRPPFRGREPILSTGKVFRKGCP